MVAWDTACPHSRLLWPSSFYIQRERERERVLVICHTVSIGSVIHNMYILCMCICVLYCIVKGERKGRWRGRERTKSLTVTYSVYVLTLLLAWGRQVTVATPGLLHSCIIRLSVWVSVWNGSSVQWIRCHFVDAPSVWCSTYPVWNDILLKMT